MVSETERIRNRVLRAVAEIGRDRIRAATRSRTVKRSLTADIVDTGVLFNVPHYWIPYYHDGRPGFSRGPRALIWYVNPSDDPRIGRSRKYPVSKSDVKRLTAGDYRDGVDKNRAMYEANPEGGRQQFMIIRNSVGPTRPGLEDPFFDKGLAEIDKVLKTEVIAAIRDSVKGFVRFDSRTLLIKI